MIVDLKLCNRTDKYITISEDGTKYFDENKAITNSEPEYLIDVGNTMNQFSLNNDSEIMPFVNILVYGNYCGKGNSGGAPIDDLDYACYRHDMCFVWGGNNTQCNNQMLVRLLPIIQVTPKFSYKWNVAVGAYVAFS